MLICSKDPKQEHLYHPLFLIGEKGALGRPAAEASHLGDRLETIKAMPKSRSKAEAKRRKKAGLDDDDS
jgi:hypothetical protein